MNRDDSHVKEAVPRARSSSILGQKTDKIEWAAVKQDHHAILRELNTPIRTHKPIQHY